MCLGLWDTHSRVVITRDSAEDSPRSHLPHARLGTTRTASLGRLRSLASKFPCPRQGGDACSCVCVARPLQVTTPPNACPPV